MVKNHLKRISTPKTWKIGRKEETFISRPSPGGQPLLHSISINTLFKEELKFAKTTKEVKNILNKSEILVDGKQTKNYRYSVGLMDVVSIPKTKENYRLLLNKNGQLFAKSVKAAEANLKPKRITGKGKIAKGITQLRFFDGHNLKVEKDEYKVGDTVVYDFKDKKITNTLKLEKGALVYLTGGAHIGFVGTVEDLGTKKIHIKTEDKIFETARRYAFVVGKDKPLIEI
jgi:small subunit ribosomal protein S4e